MGDSIVFLGTAGDSIVCGKQYRASGGIIFNLESKQFHIDPGPGALVMAKMQGINLRENTAVFVSHNHIIHANDVNAVISAMTHNGLDKKGVLCASKSVLFGSENDEPFLKDFYRHCVEKYITLEKGTLAGIENIDIRATETKHLDKKGVGFRFNTPRVSIGYTSDTEYFSNLVNEFKDIDILILNVVNPTNNESKDNLNTDDAVKLIEKIKPQLAIITHFGIKMLKADPLYEAREIQKQTGVHTIAAKDGMAISPSSSKGKQRKLEGY
ncbi:MBL fold metallo-hydrolase [Candidatus Woesearchaeota archaeon]|nr:MBL fold metallo-hydrolase [Candidatus Woesearchaeota archaeon]